jgi:CPA2 family monovalent cation:H+ antiporter-2
MLFQPASLFENTWPILAAVAIVIFGKSVAAFLIVIAFRHPAGTALTISASLAQIGEFSFILAELGVGLNLLPEEGRDLILATAIISILLNPVAFVLADRMRSWLERRAAPPAAVGEPAADQPAEADDAKEEGRLVPTAQSGHTILIGYGRVGSLVGKWLKEADVPFLVIEDADKTVAALRAEGTEVLVGNAANGEVFAAANPAAAKRLLLAIPNAFEAGITIQRARTANPAITIIARAHSDAEVDHLKSLGADTVIMGEREIARGIVELVLEKEGKQPDAATHVAVADALSEEPAADASGDAPASSLPEVDKG